jgi:hypothetical protein
MRRKPVAAAAVLAAVGFLAAACGTTGDPGASSGGTAGQSPANAQVAAMSATPVVAPGTVTAGPVGVTGQAASDVGLVLGRSDIAQQNQLLQQGGMVEQSTQATTTASDPATLVCG